MIEDSRNALFPEPNAYIQKFPKQENKKREKIVFSEPYECAPNFYLNNNFTKHNCDCIPQPKPEHRPPKPNFDFKSMLPMLLGLFQGKSNLGGLAQILNNSSDGGFDFSKIISSVMSNPDMLGNVLKLLNPKSTKKPSAKNDQTDFVIKNYTRV